MTPLSYALLGLLRALPRSGYAVRKVFETTPMGNYSSSPGSIYPALKSLEKQGLIESRPVGTRKTVLALTELGLHTLDAWLEQPVTVAEVARGMEDLMIRFVLLQDHPDRQVTLDFLRTLTLAVRDLTVSIKASSARSEWQTPPQHNQLSVDFRLRSLAGAAQWAADAYRQISATFR